MTPVYQPDACIRDWLMRVNTQYDVATPAKVKEADYARAKESLGLGNITNNYFFSPARSTPSRGWFSSGDTNSHNRTYIDNRTYYNASANSSSDSEEAKAASKKKAKEEKTDWKGIAAIGIVSTAVAGISIFVYARLSKAAEGAVNYLENTKRIKQWADTPAFYSNPRINQIAYVSQAQLKIDQRAVDKITNYKYSILTSLVGTLAIAGGGITILAAAPVLATAGTTAVVIGGVLNAIAVMYAAYNCGVHWSDEKDGRGELDQVRQSVSIPDLINSFTPNTQPQNPSREYQQPSAYNPHQEGAPPSYDESEASYQAIYNQRRGIYPDLSEFAPSAPSYV